MQPLVRTLLVALVLATPTPIAAIPPLVEQVDPIVLVPLPELRANTAFGSAVAVSGDTMVLASLRLGVYAFQPDPKGRWRNDRVAYYLSRGRVSITRGDDYFALASEDTLGRHGYMSYFTSGTVDPQQGGSAREALNVGSRYGTSIALSAETSPLYVAVGAPGDDTMGVDAGAVYVYRHEPNRSGKIFSPTPAAGERFGEAVTYSGGHLLVGAPGANAEQGKVYVYIASNAEIVAILAGSLEPAGNPGDNFGAALTSHDGSVLVGAPGTDDRGVPDAGSASIFHLPTSTFIGVTTVADAQLFANTPMPSLGLGAVVAGEGGRFAVGLPKHPFAGTDAGLVFLYEEPAGGWSGVLGESAWLVPPPGSDGAEVGSSVALDAARVVAGSSTNALVHGGGAVMWQVNPGQIGGLLESERTVGATFAHGERPAVVVAQRDLAVAGQVVLRRDPSGTWNPIALLDPPGKNLAIDDGRVLRRSGDEIHLFYEPPGGYSGVVEPTAVLQASSTAPGDALGHKGVMDGDTIVVSAPLADSAGVDDGLAYVFVEPAGGFPSSKTPVTEFATLRPSVPASGDEFGAGLAILDDLVVVGSPKHDVPLNNTGTARVFQRPASGWVGLVTESSRLVPANPVVDARFGLEIDMQGDQIVVGGKGEQLDSATWVFEEPASGWAGEVSDVARLVQPNPALVTAFGKSIGLSEGVVAVGQPMVNGSGLYDGAVRFYYEPTAGYSGDVSQDTEILSPLAPNGDLISPFFGSDIYMDGASGLVSNVTPHVLFSPTTFALHSFTLPTTCVIGGVAQGGSLSVTVGGEVLQVATAPGDEGDTIAAALALQANANSTLTARGIEFTASGPSFETNGPLGPPVVADSGLSHTVLLPEPQGLLPLWAGALLLYQLRARHRMANAAKTRTRSA